MLLYNNAQWIIDVDFITMSCSLRLSAALWLSGGSTLFDGFDKKLNKLVQKRVDNRLTAYEEISGSKSGSLSLASL
jgi:hypothetical protein